MANPTVPKSAKAIVQQFLNQYGLGSLINWAWDTYIHAGGGQTGTDAITAELPNTKEFQARFPAYQQLAKEGRAMSVQQMLDYENSARQIFHDAGLPSGFYDEPKDFAQFMLHDVSASELQQRVQLAEQATLTAAPEVRAQLQRLFGAGTQGNLTAYFLDPQKAAPILQQQYTAATIGGAAQRTGFGQLTKDEALRLAQLGVTEDTAASGFGKLGTEQGLFAQQVQGEDQIDQQTQLGATFENNAAAQLRIQRRQQERVAAFKGSTGFSTNQQGVGGLGTSDKSTT